MRANECKGCDAYSPEERYCYRHDEYIKYINSCDDYFNSDDERERMFPDGEDEN